jgi:hypothetical protein
MEQASGFGVHTEFNLPQVTLSISSLERSWFVGIHRPPPTALSAMVPFPIQGEGTTKSLLFTNFYYLPLAPTLLI